MNELYEGAIFGYFSEAAQEASADNGRNDPLEGG